MLNTTNVLNNLIVPYCLTKKIQYILNIFFITIIVIVFLFRWNLFILKYVISIFYKKNIYLTIPNFILKFNRINYQVDGLMAGRPFWEGELGVRISTAWSMKFILIFVDDLIFIFYIINNLIIESNINMRYSYLKIESIILHLHYMNTNLI